MLIEVFTIIYMIILTVGLVKQWRNLPKSAVTGFLSGIVLLGYSIYLHTVKTLPEHAFVILLAVALIQLSAFEVGKAKQQMNWVHHILRFIVHIIIVWFMLK